MMANLNNKNILIIGASSGTGLALARQLSTEQASVYAVARSIKPNLNDMPDNYKQFDVSSVDFSTLKTFIPTELHGLVYCPGSITLKPFLRLTEAEFINDYKINVLGAVKSIQAALPALKKGRPASVVLFSTVAARTGLNFHTSISAAKSAVEGLTRSLAAEYANSGIRFNAIAPSITQTPLAEHLLNSDQKMEASVKRHPLKKIGQPEDMAHAARFLLGPESGWITGQVLAVDGGLSNLKPL